MEIIPACPVKSGRQDSNLRPPHPKCGAMTGLRYAPNIPFFLYVKVAERVGFEPTVQFDPYDDLANRSFRPLRHLSLIQLFKGWQKYTINLKVKSKNEEKANKDFT